MPHLLFVHEMHLYQIKKVLFVGTDYMLLATELRIGNFDSFLNCFEVNFDQCNNEILVNVNELKNMKTFDLNTVNEKHFILAATIDLNKTNVWK